MYIYYIYIYIYSILACTYMYNIYGHVFLLSQNCHFYSYVLIVLDAKLFACLERFSSKLKCAMI